MRDGIHDEVASCPIMSRVAAIRDAAAEAPARLAFLGDGYRPFFLLAGLTGAVWVPLWLLIQQGMTPSESGLPANFWHGHEMIFGYAVAVLAGFLLTAGRAWTGLPTASGLHLAALALLWLAGRIVLLTGVVSPEPAAAIDLAFVPALAVTVAVPLVRARSYRNLVFLVVLAVLFAFNLLLHLSAMNLVAWDTQRIEWLALDVFVLVIGLIGGRIIPSFTRNALPHAAPRSRPWLERLAPAALVLLLAADLAFGQGPMVGGVALAAAVLHALRLSGWAGLATRRAPILWVLHIGYLWVVIGLTLRGLAGLVETVPADAALHALGAGAVGTMTLGMMTRVALGHAGRPLVVARPIVAAYLLAVLAAVLRVAAAFVPGETAYDHLLMSAGALWSAAFLLFVAVYFPILTQPRRTAGAS